MPKRDTSINIFNRTPEWLTMREAVDLINKSTQSEINLSDIYRHVLYGKLSISIYFQSPIILRKVQISNRKVKTHLIRESLIDRLCLLENRCFIAGRNLTISTEGEYIHTLQQIIDTPLAGYEYTLIQRLLAHSLNIPSPIGGGRVINYGISTIIEGELFQIFEKITWRERIKKQSMRLPYDIARKIHQYVSLENNHEYNHKNYFPIYDLPQDACFVFRLSEIDKIINLNNNTSPPSTTSTRISTPVSRLFWLACKNNEAISPLIGQPYKLLSIFEQWAYAEGITDHLSGDTLKAALKRGSPNYK
ncbi:hypothetical protein MXF40_03415 [Serratia marcescens]|uniref:hypothetical protein n=1 Tax=Serratia marcescens TaxID=615 RepID=UPI002DBCA4C8|nr:hypothetical protein [Serratia marcescens]MEB6080416.1 hypothetical protein [Serratia marcescens]